MQKMWKMMCVGGNTLNGKQINAYWCYYSSNKVLEKSLSAVVTKCVQMAPLDMTNKMQVSRGKDPAVESTTVYVRTLTRGGEPFPFSCRLCCLSEGQEFRGTRALQKLEDFDLVANLYTVNLLPSCPLLNVQHLSVEFPTILIQSPRVNSA